jgi:hypothetical protein
VPFYRENIFSPWNVLIFGDILLHHTKCPLVFLRLETVAAGVIMHFKCFKVKGSFFFLQKWLEKKLKEKL